MIDTVVISERAKKDLKKIPKHIVRKLLLWVETVEQIGLERTRVVPGYHDEPLLGRREGQRSIRLNRAYRAIYEIRSNGDIEFVSVEEVNKHVY